jgi:serine/threonine protein kinase
MNSRLPKTIRQYDLGDFLGSGSYSTVCQATHRKTNQVFACKVLPRRNLLDEGDHHRFQREINAMAFIRHENLVALYDFFWDDHNFYLIMDHCPGGDLCDYLSANGPFDEPTAALLFRQIAAGISCCHDSGIAHRDLKPDNILVDTFPKVKVSDFGLCGYLSDDAMMHTFCGSPCYCSPECLCKVEYDGRLADVWSLGVILYLLVTGCCPWNVANTSLMLQQIVKGSYRIPPTVTHECQSLISGMLRVHPSDRLTMGQVANHPWLTVADTSAFSEALSGSLAMAGPLAPVPLSLITLRAQESSQKRMGGIVSPFTEELDTETCFPRLCLKPDILRASLGQQRTSGSQDRSRMEIEGSMRRKNAAKLLLPAGISNRRVPKASSKTFS